MANTLKNIYGLEHFGYIGAAWYSMHESSSLHVGKG